MAMAAPSSTTYAVATAAAPARTFLPSASSGHHASFASRGVTVAAPPMLGGFGSAAGGGGHGGGGGAGFHVAPSGPAPALHKQVLSGGLLSSLSHLATLLDSEPYRSPPPEQRVRANTRGGGAGSDDAAACPASSMPMARPTGAAEAFDGGNRGWGWSMPQGLGAPMPRPDFR